MPPAFEFRGNRGNDRRPNNGRHEFTFRYARPGTAERPLLRSKREATPELLKGEQTTEEKPALKFAAVEDLSDSEEADMDVSTDDADDVDDEEESRPRKKRAIESDNAAPAPTPAPAPVPTPKWSNPDPYTVLPPPDETQQSKKVDVVKLIRKARIAASAQAAKKDAVTTNEDFISFGDIGKGDQGNPNAPENAPKGPSRHLQGQDPALGNRKRTYDDEIKSFPKKTVGGMPMKKFLSDGSVIDEWRARSGDAGSPWLSLMEPSLHLGTRLHNEILSFYHWVKPQSYEQIVRADLVARLQSAFQSRYYGAQLRPFGSFASGLYLPTADMDLVLLSTNFMRTGTKTFGERKGAIYAFAAFIRNNDMAAPGSVETIAKARVPILKFVDKLTGLKVDLSFDNDSGIVANNTFQKWSSEYPAMPVVVSIIKQFLLLRGLNEVPTGGLGGFSITCLVTSLLQHLPHGNTESNLGSILMDFFDFYGNKLDYENVGLRLSPPGYFNKRVYSRVYKDNNARLSIEDPNNSDNDISAGTREISLILRAFSDAHRLLKERMVSTAMSGMNESSILECIIAANYEEYADHRWRLREVFETDPRFASYRPLTPPPPPDSPPRDPTPQPPPLPESPPRKGRSKASKEKISKVSKKKQASRDRAVRLRKLRPDIGKVPDSISNEQAISLGGYKSQSAMDRDLRARDRA